MRIAISQPRYLPALNYLQRIAHCDLFVLLDDVQHQRRAFEHRNRVLAHGAVQWLSIPLDRGRGSRPRINDLRAGSSGWVQDHVRRLHEYYRPAPCYSPRTIEHLYAGLENASSLTDIAEIQLTRIFDLLKLPMPPVVRSSTVPTPGQGSTRLATLARSLGARAYISGPNGRDYLAAGDFAGIAVHYHDFKHPHYPQAGAVAFVPWLAWLDAWANAGADFVRGVVTAEPACAPAVWTNQQPVSFPPEEKRSCV